MPAWDAVRIMLPLYCPTAIPTLLAFTETTVGAFPLDGVELSQPESVPAAQLMEPPRPLLTVMFCAAGARLVAPKKFKDAGVETSVACTCDIARVTGMLRVELVAPYDATVMVAL